MAGGTQPYVRAGAHRRCHERLLARQRSFHLSSLAGEMQLQTVVMLLTLLFEPLTQTASSLSHNRNPAARHRVGANTPPPK